MTLRQRYRLHTHVTIWGLVALGETILLAGFFVASPENAGSAYAAGTICNIAAMLFAVVRFTNRRYYFSDEDPTDVCVQDTDG